MRFEPTILPGVFIVELSPHRDERGFFARSYCADEFEKFGLEPVDAQCNISYSATRGTVRGIHFSVEPAAEAKLVRCTRGAIWDVLVDLREDSPTYKQHVGVELTAENRRAVYIPVGVGHGMQTLADETEVFYQMSVPYVPEAQRGYRHDDPAFAINWPIEVTVVSDKDRTAPCLGEGLA